MGRLSVNLVAWVTVVNVALEPVAVGATQYWDSNGATAGAGTTPTGIWGTDSFWSGDSTGASATGAWVGGSDAVFSAGMDAVGNPTITVNGSQMANGIAIQKGALTFTGGTITLNGGGLTLNSGTGAATISSAIALGAAQDWTNSSVNTLTIGGGVDNGSYLLTIGGAGNTTVSGVIGTGGTKTGGLAKTGAGILTLSAANTYTGTSTLSAGTIALGFAENAGTSGPLGSSVAGNPGSVVLNGGTLQYSASNANDYSGRFSTAAGQKYYADTNGQTVQWATALTSSGGVLTKSGNGTLTLAGANTYTGTTTVNAGTLALDYSSQDNSKLSDTAALILGAGAVTLAGGTHTEVVASSTVNAGANGVTRSSGSAVLQMGAITRSAGGTINFGAAGIATTTSANDANGILGGWTTIGGTEWARNDGANNIVGGATYANDTWAVGNNTTVTASSAPASDSTSGSLRFNNAGGFTVTLSGVNTITSGGVLVTSTVGANTSIITGGTLQGPSGGDLVIIQNNTSGSLTISSAIGDNGTSGLTKSGSGSCTLSGANTYTGTTRINDGILIYGSGRATSETVIVGDGNGAANSAQLLNGAVSVTYATAPNITMCSDGFFKDPNQKIIRIKSIAGTGEWDLFGNNERRITGEGLDGVFSGVISGGANVADSNPGSGNRLAKSGASTQTFSGVNTYLSRTFVSDGILRIAANAALGSASAGYANATFVYNMGTLDLSNNVTVAERFYINGTGNGSVGVLRNHSGDNTISGNVTIGWAGGSVTAADASIGVQSGTTLTIGGAIDGTKALSKVGDGDLTLSGANSYTGTTTLVSGTVNLASVENVGVSGPLGNSIANNPGSIVLNGGTLRYSSINANDYSGRFGTEANQKYYVDTCGQNVTWATALTSSGGVLTKSGTGTLTLSGANTYAGATTVNGGTLKAGVVSVTDTSGAFGNNSAVTIANVASASLDITGYDTQIGSLTGGGTVGGNVTLGAATLTVGGDNTSPAAYGGVISGSGGALAKIGTGTLTLSGVNTYTGTTTVNAGTLLVNSPGSLIAASAVAVNSGGTLGGSGTINGTVSVASGGHLAPGAGGTVTTVGSLTMASGSSLDIDVSGVGLSRIAVKGTVDITDATLVFAGTEPESMRTTLIDNDGADAIVGTFVGMPEGTKISVNGVLYTITYVGGDGNDVVLLGNIGTVIRFR